MPRTSKPVAEAEINNWFVENFGSLSTGTEMHGLAHVGFVRLKNLLGLAPEEVKPAAPAAADSKTKTTESTLKE